jgi:hypothetical protein
MKSIGYGDKMSEETKSNLFELNDEYSNLFLDAANAFQKEADDLWNSLSYDDRLKVFCAVSNLIYKGEIEEKGSYRYVLYNVFNFDTDSYAAAQHAGYLSIHNAIYDGERIGETIKDFVENYLDVTDDNLDKQIDSFLIKKYL